MFETFSKKHLLILEEPLKMTPKLFFNVLKSLSLKNLLKLFFIGFSHPIFSILTFFATYKTYKISEKLFPKTHGLHGSGNAFRHALWNSLIMMYCCKVSSPKKALIWTEKITQMHEDLFPNEPLQRKMDLHNNKVGRDYFMQLLPTIHRQFFETSFFVDQLLALTQHIKTVKSEDETFGFELIMIDEKRETLA